MRLHGMRAYGLPGESTSMSIVSGCMRPTGRLLGWEPVVMTTFVFTDEQQDLRDMVRRFLAEKSPVSEVRRLMATEAGYDPAVWAQLGRLGLAGLVIPEKYGGAGCGPVEQLIVCEEMGAALLCAPYLASSVLAAGALLASGDAAAQADLLPPIASGETIATLAVPEDA